MNTADAVPLRADRARRRAQSYNLGRPSEAEVLHAIDLQVRQGGEFIALMGPRARARAPCSTSWACWSA